MNNAIKSYSPGKVAIIVAIVMAAYMIFPVDLIPDFIAGLGQIDDVAILGTGTIIELINLFYGMHLKKAAQESATTSTEYSNEYDGEDGYGNYREV